jgi:flagellar biosynthetic protein FlhB
MSQERTEKPTKKKLKEARERGQIARSRDLALAAASVAATIALARFGARLIVGLTERLSGELAHFGDAPMRTVTSGDLTQLIVSGGLLLGSLVSPIALATMVAGVGMHGFQGGWSFSPGALQLNWSRLNPANGVKKLGMMQTGADTAKTLVTVSMIGFLAWKAVHGVVEDSVRMAWLGPVGAAMLGWEHAEDLLWQVAWGLGLFALGDYGLQYYRTMSQLKMTRQEVADEAKSSEGNAEVKGKMRRIQRDMARRRMIADVAQATVVITNPTHFAVAIEYRRESMAAPRVLAKGQDHLALKIREAAREHGVPIMENKPLAQALYKTAEVGQTIPAELFSAVAEVLAYLIRIKQLML